MLIGQEAQQTDDGRPPIKKLAEMNGNGKANLGKDK